MFVDSFFCLSFRLADILIFAFWCWTSDDIYESHGVTFVGTSDFKLPGCGGGFDLTVAHYMGAYVVFVLATWVAPTNSCVGGMIRMNQ